MRNVLPRCVLAVVAALAVTVGQAGDVEPAFAGFPAHHNRETWLDRAVAKGQCPTTPVNVSAAVRGRLNAVALRARVSIVGDTLQIKGTGNSDHIVIRSSKPDGVVRVQFDGIHLGHFGPVERIVVQGGDGDNVIIVGQDVGLPARLKGGLGDDCLQGGAGADVLLGGGGNDVLIAGTGRPALKTGWGNSRIVVPHPMGALDLLPSARAGLLSRISGGVELLPLLNELYTLRLAGISALHPARTTGRQNPIIVAPTDLTEAGTVPLLQQTYAAGQAIVLVDATADQAAELRTLLGHPNAAKSIETGEEAALIFFRKVPRPGGTAYDYSTGIIPGGAFLASALSGSKERIIELLSRIFSATAIVPEGPSDSPSDDLTKLADSYTSSALATNHYGSSAQIQNWVWAVRSFTNQADFYYVLQEVDYFVSSSEDIVACFGMRAWADNQDLGASPTPTLSQPSPATTQCQETTTSGVNWNIGGSTGWNKAQGLNATLTAGATITNSTSVSCPETKINNASDPSTGQTHWRYDLPACSHPGGLYGPFTNQWVWAVPFSSYLPGQQIITVSSRALTCFDYDGPVWLNGTKAPWGTPTCDSSYWLADAWLESAVALPFGDTFVLQQPTVSSVSATCVEPGANFYIYGTALYPSTVSAILIGGTPMSSANFTPMSDTSILVTAPPSTSKTAQIVVVQTELGQSNSNVTIQIGACRPPATGGPTNPVGLLLAAGLFGPSSGATFPFSGTLLRTDAGEYFLSYSVSGISAQVKLAAIQLTGTIPTNVSTPVTITFPSRNDGLITDTGPSLDNYVNFSFVGQDVSGTTRVRLDNGRGTINPNTFAASITLDGDGSYSMTVIGTYTNPTNTLTGGTVSAGLYRNLPNGTNLVDVLVHRGDAYRVTLAL